MLKTSQRYLHARKMIQTDAEMKQDYEKRQLK